MPVPVFSAGEVLTAANMNKVGMWKIAHTTFSAVPSVTVDNVFTTDYRNYRVVVDAFGVSNGNTIRLTYLNSTGTEQTSGYFSTLYWYDYASATTTATAVGSTTFITLAYLSATNQPGSTATFDITTPQTTTEGTGLVGNHAGVNSGTAYAGGFMMGTFTATTSMRGFILKTALSTNMTGTVSVYGYNK